MQINSILLWIVSLEHIYLLIWSGFVIAILLSHKQPTSTMSWLFIITIMPIFGMALYLFLGINWRQRAFINSHKTTSKKSVLYILNSNLVEYEATNFFNLRNNKNDYIKEFSNHSNKEIINLIYDLNKTLPNLNQSCEIYHNGKNAFSVLIKDLENAKETIFMQYFIWRSDALGKEIKNLLIQKANEGIKIKLLFDGAGSFFTISRKYKRALEDAGVEFLYFLNIKNSLLKLNYRNHRKMTIIDGKILHSGGMNLGLEYITGGKKFQSWKDTNFRIVGDMAIYYLAVFATDWLNSNGKFDFSYFDKIIKKDPPFKNGILMQAVYSGPDSKYPAIKFLYTKFITNAKKEILIQTPYFTPNHSIIQQLKIASLSSVKVKILTVGKPDKLIPYWVGQTYIEELLASNVEIYRYKKGFLHSKFMLYDDEISTIGTCNFDSRSFNINYEINTVFYDKKINANLKAQFYKDLKNSVKITPKLYKKNFLVRLRNSFFRLVAPIL